ncbi:MAG: hypothetical protein Q8P41_19830 [Pseudomonadota bacterium]|nr:hypothetical protein [Pseudomonadota bacterium]
MYIERIEVVGFGGLPRFDEPLDRTARFDGSPRALVALEDAVQLAFAAWDADALRALLARWGCVNPVVEGTGLPEGAHWEAAPGLGAVLERGADGLLIVGLTIMLDPPQFGKLRRLAARDNRLIDALAEGARLTVRIGARFSPALDALALDPLGFVLGAEAFPIAGADRPVWMTPFLQGLRGRLWRGPIPGPAWGDKARSYRAEDQRALRRALDALSVPPAALGDAVALPDGPAVYQGDDLVALRHLGPDAEEAAGLVGAVHLSGAEILLVNRPPPAWVEWLAQQAEADGSPLEQVILIGTPGGRHLG